jgi:hypothetical protein
MKTVSEGEYDRIHPLELNLLILYTSSIAGITGYVLSSRIISADPLLIGLITGMAGLTAVIPWMITSTKIEEIRE